MSAPRKLTNEEMGRTEGLLWFYVGDTNDETEGLLLALCAEARRARAEEKRLSQALCEDGKLEAELARLRASNAALRTSLQNTLAVLLTYDITEEHGVVVQARAALADAQKAGQS